MTRRRAALSALLAWGLAAAVATSAAARPETPVIRDDAPGDDGGESVAVRYGGSIFGVRVLRADLTATTSPTAYAAHTRMRTAGLVGFVRRSEINGRAEGRVAPALDGAPRVRPRTYSHLEINGRKRREVRLGFAAGDVDVAVTPPFSSLGDPPASAAQRAASLDPLSAIVAIALQAGASGCSGRTAVFDSKQRYDLVAETIRRERVRTRGYRGDALRCRIWYRPVAGFDPDDLGDPEDYDRPATVWFMDDGRGFAAPVKIRLSAGGVPVRIEALKVVRSGVSGGESP